jgi:hypothetical protein
MLFRTTLEPVIIHIPMRGTPTAPQPPGLTLTLTTYLGTWKRALERGKVRGSELLTATRCQRARRDSRVLGLFQGGSG